MWIPGRYRRALVLVAIAPLFALLIDNALAQRAFNFAQRVANAYATGVAHELFGEVDGSATALAANPLVTALLSELGNAGVADELIGTDEGLSTGPNQHDPQAFGGLEGDLPAPDLLAPESLEAALGADPVFAEANPPGFVVVLSEPTALAVFGVGLLALGSRLRRVRRLRARS